MVGLTKLTDNKLTCNL